MKNKIDKKVLIGIGIIMTLLIVSIIILLILAGVTVATLTGDNRFDN